MLASLPYRHEKAIQNWREDPRAIQKFKFIHHFIPHAYHKTRAQLLSTRAFLGYFLALFLVLGSIKLLPKVIPGILGYASNIFSRDLLTFTNQKRQEAGLHTLTVNPVLAAAAKKKAEDMFEKGYWAHVSPEGVEPWDFILAEGYDYSYAGENLAKNFNDSKDVVDAWYKSPSHKENLLSANYDEVGFAVVNGVLDGYETTLVVQMFGKSRNPKPIATRVEVPETPAPVTVSALEEQVAPAQVVPKVDVAMVVKVLAFSLGGFLTVLLLIDLWYSKKHGIIKLSGHTLAHLVFLVVTFVSIWVALVPGRVL